LLFSVQESKGLEYENIILFNFISDHAGEFQSICDGVTIDALHGGDPVYARGKDKSDKSHDAYKFYINALYVAITRAVRSVYMVEKTRGHKLLGLLGVSEVGHERAIREEVSSADDWKREARRLEMMGKSEQADAIRKNILTTVKPNWVPITAGQYLAMKDQALDPEHFNKKAKDHLFEFALIYNQKYILEKLAALNYRKADKYEDERNSLFRKYYQYYREDNLKMVAQEINKYGIDYRNVHNFTPLHAAVYSGAIRITESLLENGADPGLYDTFYKSPLQIALLQAFISPDYARNKLGKIYPLLLKNSLYVQVDGRLIKIDPHKVEFMALHFFLAVQSAIQQSKTHWQGLGIRVNDFIDALQVFPETVIPLHRKKRPYWMAILAKHEIDGNNPYNKRLFMRIDRGLYVLNPAMQIRYLEDWFPVDVIINCQGISHEDMVKHSVEKQVKIHEESARRWEQEKKRREREAHFRNNRGGWYRPDSF
jgi:hypothetical protein